MSEVLPRPGDPAITPELVKEHGLTPGEFDRVSKMLGRAPTFTELGIVSALWNEHCSYKHSKNTLRTLPTEGAAVIQGPGENAGVVRIGDGIAIAFKIESHNHPSAIEPYQGAATGVGGILRDVFTMGARPIAMLNSLRFGSLDSARNRYLFAGVVRGIGDYGNCIGVPTVAGEIVFDPAYDGNPLVNAMCVGMLREDELILAKAQGVGNSILCVGARTGRDGIHGASFASEDLSEASEAKRPRVQVGDPFTEKLLLEASLELIRSGHIVAIQDMGVSAIAELPEERDPAWTMLKLLASPTIASKRWAFQQYDSTVRTNTVVGPGGDAAVLRIRGTDRAIAVKTDCNGRYVALDPRVGGRIAVAEAARNVACTGARPLAITNCLNFGNPTRPEIFFQFTEAVAGISEACIALDTPVTGGNVSFYNESPTGSVYPTPVIGMVGVIDSLEHITRSTFRNVGDAIVLLGDCTDEIGGSEYLATVHGVTGGAPPGCDIVRERAVIDTLLEAIRAGVVASAHDCSDGGLAVAIAECVMANPDGMVGADIDLTDWDTLPLRAVLFGEAQGRIIVSSGEPERILQIAAANGVPARKIGTVTPLAAGLMIRTHGKSVSAGTEMLAEAYHTAIPRIMNTTPQSVATDDIKR